MSAFDEFDNLDQDLGTPAQSNPIPSGMGGIGPSINPTPIPAPTPIQARPAPATPTRPTPVQSVPTNPTPTPVQANTTPTPMPTPSDPRGGRAGRRDLRGMMKQETDTLLNQAADMMKEEKPDLEEEPDVETEILMGNGGGNKKWLWIGIAAVCLLLIIVCIVKAAGKKPKPEETQVSTSVPDVVDWVIEEEPEETIMPEANYTTAQLMELKMLGATDDYIEELSKSNVDYKYAWYITKEKAQSVQLDNALDLSNLKGFEYQDYVSQTWLALDERTDMPEWDSENIYNRYTIQQNLDYEKIPVHGSQLFLKIYLDANKHSKWFFLCVSPEEWNDLDSSGNVVVDYTYETHKLPRDVNDPQSGWDEQEDAENIFILDAKLNIIKSLSGD